MANTLTPPLLPVEQIGPKGWVRVLFCFELPENYNIDEVTALLKTSYSAFKARTPIAGCEVVPLEGKQAGLLQLRRYSDDEIDDFTVKDLREPGAFPYTFTELSARGFPASALKVDELCKRGLGGEWPTRPGDRLNVTMVQANFIRGGLLLNMLFLHAYADCTSVYKFSEIFAEELRRAQGITITNPVEIPVEDREKLLNRSGLAAWKPENHPEYIELPFAAAGPPPKLASDIHHGHVFFFSPESIKALKQEASPANAKLFKGEDLPAFVSTNDVISALIWRATMAAQHPDLNAAAAAPSIFGVALDARRRAGIPVHKYTLGNILGFAPAILDLKTVVSPEEASLADLAIAVRRAVAKCDNVYLDNLNAVVEKLEDVNRLAPTMFLDMPGNNALQSSWREFPYYDIEWGPAFGDRVKAIRPPNVGVTHSMQIVLPDRPGRDGVEVFVGVQHEAMDKLLNDPLWNKYAEKPVDLGLPN